MKLALNLSFFLFALLTFSNRSFSLNDYQIRKICSKEKRQLSCIKNLQEQRYFLQKGNPIKIPVIPYEGNQKLNFKFWFKQIKGILVIWEKFFRIIIKSLYFIIDFHFVIEKNNSVKSGHILFLYIFIIDIINFGQDQLNIFFWWIYFLLEIFI